MSNKTTIRTFFTVLTTVLKEIITFLIGITTFLIIKKHSFFTVKQAFLT